MKSRRKFRTLSCVILLLFIFSLNAEHEDTDLCRFPESEIQPFFFDIRSDTPPESIILDTVVDPPDAHLEIADIRSNNLPHIDFTSLFEVVSRSVSSGQFFLINSKSLLLPNYPSKINETLLYVTISCNGRNYPLITVRVRNFNTFAPEFYNEPYEVTVLKNSVIGAQYVTPILSLDRDPSDIFSLRFAIQSGAHNQLALVSEQNVNYKVLNFLPDTFSKREEDWVLEQLPHLVHLKVLSALTRSIYYLNISVTDGGFPEKKVYTQLKVMVKNANEIMAKFTQHEYYANFTKNAEVGSDLIPNQQIFATFPSVSQKVIYELVESEFSDLISLDPITARIRIQRPIINENIPQNIQLQIKAYPQGDPEKIVTTILNLNDVSEIRLTYFAQCHYEAHLLENPSTYTRVLQFNFKGDVDSVELLNGTKYFEVNSDGTVFVKFGAEIDREKIDKIVVKARLKSLTTLHPKSLELCQVATADVFIDDFNDHTPKFDKVAYTFYLDLLPYNNTEVGTVTATDADKGEFGRVRYRILADEYESLPFIIFQADGSATIYYTTKERNYFPEKSYTFPVEAFDSDVDPRTSRVSVHVILENEAEAKERQRTAVTLSKRGENSADFEENGDVAVHSDRFSTAAFGLEEQSPSQFPGITLTPAKTTVFAKFGKPQKNQRNRAHHSKQLKIGERNAQIEKSSSSKSIEIEQTVDPEIIEESKDVQVTVIDNTQRQSVPSKIYLKQLDWAAEAAKNHKNASGNKHSINNFNDNPTTSTTIQPPPLTTTDFRVSLGGVKFDSEYYNFSLKGRLEVGDYIGMVQVLHPIKITTDSGESQLSNDSELDAAHVDRSQRRVDFAVEEGIVGFVEIDPLSGRLSVGQKLIEDTYEEIRFSVVAQSEKGEILATTLVTVLMDDVASMYDAKPVFEKAFYIFDIDENQIFERFGKVQAHHKAAERRGAKDRLWYVLDRKLADTQFFRIDPESGWLSNRVQFDAENRKRYTIKVSACLETNTTLCGTTDVVVLIRDVNDNAPIFNRSSFDVKIPLNLPAGTELLRITAADADSGPNAEVEYSLRVPESFQELFEINSKTGAISLAKRLGTNRENVAEGLEYRLNVDAQDHGNPPMSSTASILFHTGDINPSSPVFEKFRYEVTFDSPIPPETEIIQVLATDSDPGFDGQVFYRFADFDQQTNAKVSKQFTINSNTGRIFAVTRVDPPLSLLNPPEGDDADSETKNLQAVRDHTIQLVVEAIDRSKVFARKSQTVVVVHLRPPKRRRLSEIEFIPLPKAIFISSAKSAGANILKVSVRGKDGFLLSSADRIGYEVTSDNFDYFEMRSDQMIVKKNLEPSEFDIKIRAKIIGSSEDSGGKESAEIEHKIHVIIMKNREKYPVFEKLSYEIQVNSNSQLPVIIPSLNATLLTGRIEYSIYSSKSNFSNLNDNFIFIDKITGELTLFEELLNLIESENSNLNLIEKFFVIRAKNVDFPRFYSDVSVRLEIHNRRNSQFAFASQLYRFEARENLPVGSVINTVSFSIQNNEDVKFSNVRYYFEPASKVFGILANGSIILMNSLDLEKCVSQGIADSHGIINLNVIAESDEFMANSKVEIAVLDENEFAPEFELSEYNFEIRSPISAGSVVGRVLAKDSDFSDRNTLNYRATSGNALNYLTVDNEGKIVKNSFKQFEVGKVYELKIEATDSAGHIGETLARFTTKNIDDNLHRNVWKPTKIGKEDNFPIILSSDKKWKFRIASGNDRGQFHLSQFNDSTAELEMLSLPSTADKNIERNKVLQIEAVNENDALEISQTNVTVDFEKILQDSNEFKFLDNANGGSAEGSITVDLHSLEDGIPVYQFKAGHAHHDSNHQIHYSISGESGDIGLPIFRIDAISGELYVNLENLKQSNVNLNLDEFEILVEAIDTTSNESVRKVYVLHFRTDDDGNLTKEVSTKSDSNESIKNKGVGNIPELKGDSHSTTTFTASSIPSFVGVADEETSTLASTTVLFQLSSKPSSSNSLEADLVPNFVNGHFNFVVKKPRRDQLIGPLTMQSEEGVLMRRPLVMFIEPPQFRNWFIVDPRTSLLFIRQVPTNLAGRQRAEFFVVAHDANRPELRTQCNVTVDLILSTPSTVFSATVTTDAASVLPQLTEFTMALPISTTTTPSGTPLGEFSTDDHSRSLVKEGGSATIEIGSTTSPHFDGKTSVDDLHFTLSTNEVVDERRTSKNSIMNFIETVTEHVIESATVDDFTVQEIGEESNQRATTTPTVELSTLIELSSSTPMQTTTINTTVSNSALHFLAGIYKAVLPEGNYGSRGALVTLKPHSLRQGMPKGVAYFMESDDSSVPFYVRNDTGDLIAFAEIDRETVDKYQFKVVALSRDSNDRAETLVEIAILDVNDNYPQFVESELARVVAVDSSTLRGTVLTRIAAIDADAANLGKVMYKMEENFNDLFEIDAQSGELRLSKAIPASVGRDTFHITVAALDGGRPALKSTHRIRVEIFSDTHGLPVFKQREYRAENISEEAGERLDSETFVAQVSAGASKFRYALNELSSDLFKIDENSGIIRLNRRPMDSELNRNYALNVTASTLIDGESIENSTIVHVFLNGKKLTTSTSAPSTSLPAADTPLPSSDALEGGTESCDFERKLFNAEIRENSPGRHHLTTLRSRNCEHYTGVRYSLHQGPSSDFELNEETGEFFAVKLLDREKKSLHLVIVNITFTPPASSVEASESSKGPDTSDDIRLRRQASASKAIVDFAKKKLAKVGQALVVVRVLDENDNSPMFTHLNTEGIYVFVADWEAPLLQTIAKIHATDADERATNNLTFSFGSVKSDYFAINSTSGVITLKKTIRDVSEEVFNLELAVSDGVHESRVPMKIYKLEPGVNMVVADSDRSFDKVNERAIEGNLTRAMSGVDVNVLFKQVFVENGQPDPQRTQLLIYALDKGTRVPLDGERLKKLLNDNLPRLKDPAFELDQLKNITLPQVSGQVEWQYLALYSFGGALMVLVCMFFLWSLNRCKSRQRLAKSDMEYMVGSEAAGPRPYNVELISRKMAQNILASRQLPDPYEEVTLSPESRATMIASSSTYNASRAGNISSNTNQANSRVESLENTSTIQDPTSRAHQTVLEQSSESASNPSSKTGVKSTTSSRPMPSIIIGSTMA